MHKVTKENKLLLLLLLFLLIGRALEMEAHTKVVRFHVEHGRKNMRRQHQLVT